MTGVGAAFDTDPLAQLAGRIEEWTARCAADRELGLTGRWCDEQVRLWSDGESMVLSLLRGIPSGVAAPRADGRYRIELIGTPAAWRGLLTSTPPPGHTDLVALHNSAAAFRVAGDFLLFLQQLAALNRVFELARDLLRATP